MKKLFYLLSLALIVASPLYLSTCKKDEPNKPTLVSLSPSSGHEGDPVVISGTFLGSAKKVKFGATDGVVIDPKGGEVTTQVPAGLALGKIDVTVQTDAGTSNAISFTVIPKAPIITSIAPLEGSIGSLVVLSGSFFTTVNKVTFGTIDQTTIEAGKTDTGLSVKVPTGVALGAIDVTVTSDGGISNKISFTVVDKPTIISFLPVAGPVGTLVTITGTTLEDATKISFGGSAEIDVTKISATSVSATVPVGATTGKIKVKTPGGEALSADDFLVKGLPVVTSFTPGTGTSGTEVTITGSNFDAPGLAVTFGTTAAVTFTKTSDTEVKATVPNGTATGKIKVTTIVGTGTSSTDFVINNGPTVTNFSPTSGPVGTSVVITGTNFTGATSVQFNTTEAVGFVINSATQITATVPAGAATGLIKVTTPLGNGSGANAFTIVSPPTVTSFSPTSAAVGTSITITGTNFTGATVVKFGGVSAITFTIVSATQITATVPAGAANGTIAVTGPGGIGTSSASFTVIGGPTITSFSPTSGIVGATITLTGTNLTGATTVKFNGVAATTFTVNNATQITVTVPAGASSGTISVQTPGGTGTSSASFTVIGAPTISGFSPAQGAVGSTVIITGTTLTGATSVKFNGVAATTFTVNSATQITVTVPAAATSGTISVMTPAGTGASTNSFTVVPPPTITSFSPLSGAVGQTITITGTSFISVTGVTFNGVAVVTYTPTTTQITAVIPAGATTGKIAVATQAGTATSANNFTVAPAPTITSFTPTTTAIGQNVTITGTNFVNVSSVKFHGTEVGVGNFTVNSVTQITAKVPAGTTNGTLTVTTPSGTGTSAGSFTVLVAPTITSFAPGSGIVGTSVVITGTTFTGATGVKFNGVAATFTVNSTTQITATVPAGATTGTITVTNVAGTGTSATSFTLLLAPLIGSISPTTATAGTTLTILGSNLLNATSVKFGGTTVTVLASNTDSQIKVVIPALATGAVNVSVVTGGGTSNTKTLTVVAAPVISSLKPNVSYKGFPIMILGSNLAGIVSAKVGTTDATVMSAYDANAIITIPPSIGNGTYNVTVSNEGGASNAVSINIVTAPGSVGAPPSGTFVSPPPADYVNAVSNFWFDDSDPTNSDSKALNLATPGTTCQIENGAYPDNSNYYVCGTYSFSKDGAGNVTSNYVQLQIGTGNPPTNLETFYGQWSATVPDPCYQHLVLISSTDGHLLRLTVEVDTQLNYPSGTCH